MSTKNCCVCDVEVSTARSAVVCDKCSDIVKTQWCGGCGRPVAEEEVVHNGRRWHASCFARFYPDADTAASSAGGVAGLAGAAGEEAAALSASALAAAAAGGAAGGGAEGSGGDASVERKAEEDSGGAAGAAGPSGVGSGRGGVDGGDDSEPRGMASVAAGDVDLSEMIDLFSELELIADRDYYFKPYRHCVVGSEAVDALVEEGPCASREEAVLIGRRLVDEGFLEHILREHHFIDDYLFYTVTSRARGVGASGTRVASEAALTAAAASRPIVGRVHRSMSVEPTMTGWLHKRGHLVRNWKKRWFILRRNTLTYFRTYKDREPAGALPLALFKVDTEVELTKAPSSNIIALLAVEDSKEKDYYLAAETAAEVASWKKAIESAQEAAAWSEATRKASVADDIASAGVVDEHAEEAARVAAADAADAARAASPVVEE